MKIIHKLLLVAALLTSLVFVSTASAQYTNLVRYREFSLGSPNNTSGLQSGHTFYNPTIMGFAYDANSPWSCILEFANYQYAFAYIASGSRPFDVGVYENPAPWGSQESGPQMTLYGPTFGYPSVHQEFFEIDYIRFSLDGYRIEGISLTTFCSTLEDPLSPGKEVWEIVEWKYQVPLDLMETMTDSKVYSILAVPEPSAGALAGLGVLTLISSRRFRHK